MLNDTRQLSEALKGVPEKDLEAIFGGHDFFVSVLQHKLKDKKRRSEALRMGAAYLFTNQLLFYVLLSRASELAREENKNTPIRTKHHETPKRSHDRYFEKLRDIHYERISGWNL